jgi:hypothetical protein
MLKYTFYRNKLNSAFENKIHVLLQSMWVYIQKTKAAEHIIYAHVPMSDILIASMLTSAVLFCWRHATIHSTHNFV